MDDKRNHNVKNLVLTSKLDSQANRCQNSCEREAKINLQMFGLNVQKIHQIINTDVNLLKLSPSLLEELHFSREKVFVGLMK